MKKKMYPTILSFAALTLIVIGIFYFNAERNKGIYPQADWNSHYNNVEDLIENANLIIRGKVVDAVPEQRVNMVFTMQKIEINKVYAGDSKEGEVISILQTGGILNGFETHAFREAPLWEIGEEYLLFLEYTDEGHYLPMGGYQGAGKIKNNKVIFSNIINDEIRKSFSGKSFYDIDNFLDEQTENDVVIK